MEKQTNIFKVFIDGGSRGNPGPCAVGVVIECGGTVILEHGENIGLGTNNYAEYTALIRALEKSAELHGEGIHIFTDSELLHRQMTGVYAIKNEHLRKLALQIKQLERQFKYVRYTQIPREQNTRADKLVNSAFDEFLKPQKTMAPSAVSAELDKPQAPKRKSITLNAACPDCHKEISSTYKFCPHCGLGLKD